MPTNFGWRGEGDQRLDGRQRLLGGVHRVGAGGPEDARVRLGDGADLRRLAQAGADRHHAGDAGGARRGRRRRRSRRRSRGSRGGNGCRRGRAGASAASGVGSAGQAARARASAAAASICRKVSRITWAGSRLTARAWPVRSASRGTQLGPEPGLGRGARRARAISAGLGVGGRGDRRRRRRRGRAGARASAVSSRVSS